MNDHLNTEIKPSDEPLFVLRYQPYKVVMRGIVYGAIALVIGFGAPLYPYSSESCLLSIVAIIVGGLIGFFVIVPAFFDVLLSREIHLYKDRIVKIRRLFGNSEIDLANAGLSGWCSFACRAKWIFRLDANTVSRAIGALWVDETLANWEEVEQLNNWLSRLSGRSVEEFKQAQILMMPLINKEEQ